MTTSNLGGVGYSSNGAADDIAHAFDEEHNVWEDDAPDAPETSSLSGEERADIAIVGAGYTGLWAALHLAQKGHSVTVVEAKEIGFGASGRNVGLVNAGLWVEPVIAEHRLGRVFGPKLYKALAQGPERVFRAIEAHRMPADAVRNGTLHLASDADSLESLKLRRDQLAGRRAPVELLSADETAARTGSEAFEGALFDPRAGTVQPLALARSIARAAIAAGARIFTQTHVEDVRRVEGKWRIVARGGRLSADTVMLATNAYSSGGAEAVRRSIIPAGYFQVATTPLRVRVADTILPGGEGAWDNAAVMTSFRRDKAGRLILGSIGRLPQGKAGVHGDWAVRRLQQLFPDLGPVEVRRAWSGEIAMTPDHLPRIAEYAPGLISVYGFNGRGVAPALVLGQAAADFMVDRDQDALPLPLEIEPHFAPLRDFRGQMLELGARIWHSASARL